MIRFGLLLLRSHTRNSIPRQFRSLEREARQHPQLIILDECDRLLAWGDDFMQRLFALPFCKGSQMVLIGIANAGATRCLLHQLPTPHSCSFSVDLVPSFLPLLLKQGCAPSTVHFPPCAPCAMPIARGAAHLSLLAGTHLTKYTSCCSAGCLLLLHIAVEVAFSRSEPWTFARESVPG
jgi:hypothetical protein